MFLQILGCLACVGVGGFLGYSKSQSYKKREQTLRDIILMCDRLVSDISYFQPHTDEIMKRYIESFPALKDQLTVYKNIIDQREDISIETLEKKIPKGVLKDDEYILFLSLLEGLGKSDSLTQCRNANSVKDALSPKLNAAIEENKKYGNLYFKVGVLCGAALGIVIL